MSYLSNLKLFLRFNSTSLYEDVSGSYLTAAGDNQSVQILEDGGYSMQNNQYLYGVGGGSGFSTSIGEYFTIGFWLYSNNIGMVTNPITGEAESIEMPIMDFVSGNNSIIRITEHTTDNESNYLKIHLIDTDYSASSEEYDTQLWHFFWFVYDGTSSSVLLYVDGKQQSLTSVGAVPSSIGGSQLILYINHSMDGYAYNKAKNVAYLGEMFVLNTANNNLADIQKSINLGADYIVNANYVDKVISSYSIFQNNPTTITINSSIDDMSYIFLARNDGKILRGSPSMWSVRKTYSNSKEAESLGLPYYEPLSSPSAENYIKDGFLNIKSTTIRL